MKKEIISILMILVFTSINAQYYYMGSTIEEVISIEGEPNSVTDLGSTKILTFENGMVTFENNKVKSYSNFNNNNKLKVKYKRESYLSTKTTPKKTTSKKTIVKNKYIYFEYIATGKSEFDPIFNIWRKKSNSYSNIYQISGYTEEKKLYLESCLRKNYKSWSGKNCFLEANVFDSSEVILSIWNSETGDLIEYGSCDTYSRKIYKYM